MTRTPFGVLMAAAISARPSESKSDVTIVVAGFPVRHDETCGPMDAIDQPFGHSASSACRAADGRPPASSVAGNVRGGVAAPHAASPSMLITPTPIIAY